MAQQQTAPSSAYDAVVIGGGFAGLSAGALLGKQGKRVLILERAARLGGRAAYYEEDGFVWQYGQHSHRLERDGIAAHVFDRLGTPLDFIDTRGDTAYLYLEEKLYPRPEGLFGFLLSPLLPFASRLNFLRFYLRLLRQTPEDWYDQTLLEMYRTWYADPAVERFLSFLGFTVMIPDPARVSAGEVIQFLKRAVKARVKQGEPVGGSKQVLDTLEGVIRQCGSLIRTGEPATAIMLEHGRAVGVQTHEAVYRAGHVVYAAPLFALFGLIDETHFNPGFVAHAKGIRSSSGLSIDFVFDEAISAIRGGILGVDIPLWVKFQSNLDPSIAPRGKHVTTWAMLFDDGAEITPQCVAHTEARIKEVLEVILPGATGKIVRERKLVLPVVNANMLIPSQSYPHRPAIVCDDVKGLYFIGDTTRAEGCSGDIAFASAMRLAELLA